MKIAFKILTSFELRIERGRQRFSEIMFLPSEDLRDLNPLDEWHSKQLKGYCKRFDEQAIESCKRILINGR